MAFTEISSVDDYLRRGCLRCPLGDSPDCKVHVWAAELKLLRSLLIECGLVEEIKWSMPCYTVDGRNVLILAAFKGYCGLNFFKGCLVADPLGMLELGGPNSAVGRVLRIRSLAEIEDRRQAISDLVSSAMAVERRGLPIPDEFRATWEVPEELQMALDSDPDLWSAFESLTPGRQRSHAIFISGAKQSATRVARVGKCIPKILAGEGMMEWSGRRAPKS